MIMIINLHDTMLICDICFAQNGFHNNTYPKNNLNKVKKGQGSLN